MTRPMSVAPDGDTVPCQCCGKPTRMTATRFCDMCWESDTRIEDFLRHPYGRARVLLILARGMG